MTTVEPWRIEYHMDEKGTVRDQYGGKIGPHLWGMNWFGHVLLLALAVAVGIIIGFQGATGALF